MSSIEGVQISKDEGFKQSGILLRLKQCKEYGHMVVTSFYTLFLLMNIMMKALVSISNLNVWLNWPNNK